MTQPKNSVLILGLPADATVNYIRSFVSEPIARGNQGQHLVVVFPPRAGAAYCSAKITFPCINAARRFINSQNNRPPPASRNRLTVKFYEERPAPRAGPSQPLVINKHSNKPKTIVRNVIYVQGLSKTADEGDVINALEIAGSPVKKVRIYKYDDGKSQGRGVVSFANPASAQRCIDMFNGTRFPGMTVAMQMGLFESTKIRRLREAEGNDHLFPMRSTGYAYNCPACFETWDERDMIGCVPIGRETTDMETHFMCHGCIKDYARSLTTDGVLGQGGTGLPCSADGCKRVTLWAPVRRLLEREDRAAIRVLEKRLDAVALNGIKGLEYCKKCEVFAAILDQDTTRMQFFSCQKPDCMAQFCRICKVDFDQHAGKSCTQVDPRQQQERARLAYEEELSKAVVRICPKCHNQFTKESGCNKMSCSSCGTTMCYLCRAVDITYDHFNNGRCQTHQDSTAFDRERLDKIRQDARNNALTSQKNEGIIVKFLRAHCRSSLEDS